MWNREIIKRWTDVLGLAIASTAVVLVTGVMVDFSGEAFTRVLDQLPTPLVPLLLTVLCGLTLVPVIHLRGLAEGHYSGTLRWLRRPARPPRWLRYPPALLAVGASLLVLFALGRLETAPSFLRFQWDVWIMAASVVLAAVLWTLVARDTRGAPHRIAKEDAAAVAGGGARARPSVDTSTPDGAEGSVPASSSSVTELAQDPEALIRWLEREGPIDCPEDDLFGRRDVALRLATRLGDVGLQTFGIVGPRGMGKTSLFRLMEHYLRSEQVPSAAIKPPRRVTEVWTVYIDGWGLVSGPGAAEYVLERVVETMATHVDCLAVADLPAHYREALGGGGAPWSEILASLFSGRRSPMDRLRELDRILEAVDARLVIIVEDLDRNAEAASVYKQVEALLDRVRRLSRVSFILAVSEAEDEL